MQRPILTVTLLAVAVALVGGCAPDDRDPKLAALSRWEDRRVAPADSLTALIGSSDAIVRRAALRTAGLIGRTDVLPAMITSLDDRSQAVRGQAAFSLGLLGGDVALVPLSGALDDPHLAVRVAALSGLAHQDHDGSVLYESALQGEEREATVAWTALRRVATKAQPDSLLAAIRAGLARPEDRVRWRVLRCAERAPDSTLVAQIAPYATDRNVQVRVHALRALARHRGASALAAVLHSGDRHGRLHGRNLSRVRVAEMRALGRLAGPILASDPEGNHTSLAGRTTAQLADGATGQDPAVATVALEAMATAVADLDLPAEAATQQSLLPVWRLRLTRAARDGLVHAIPAVRAAAHRAYGALRGRGAIKTLVTGLADPDQGVVESTLAALFALDPESREFCAWTREVRANLPVAGEAAIVGSLPILVTALRVHGALLDPVTRFPRRDDPACLPSLAWWTAVRGLGHPDFVVRTLAAPVLGSFPGARSRAEWAAAWNHEQTLANADVVLALLNALPSLAGSAVDSMDFTPRCAECAFFEAGWRDRLATTEDAAAAAPDVTTRLAGALRGAFDDPDLRIRLAARDAALATELLTPTLIPAAASLRETLPPHQRRPEEAPRSLPFDAPDLRVVTDRGSFTIELDTRMAPNTCAAFLQLVNDGFHDDLVFHRVVPDFVIQGGCPRGDGWGDPGWTIRSEWSSLPFERGTVGIAHSGKDTGGSQWFVCHSAQPHLDGRYTIFGRVTAGLDAVDRIQRGDRYRIEIVAD